MRCPTSHRVSLAIGAAALAALGACSAPNNGGNNDDNNGVVVITDDAGETLDTSRIDVSSNDRDTDTTDPDVGGDCRTEGCPDDRVCNSADGRCVACVADAECGADASCDPDKNECVCHTGFHDCGSGCVPETSPDACGSGCEVCPAIAAGTRACVDGACVGQCEPPLQLDEESNACVGCLEDADCTDAASSVCEAGACTGCGGDADCAHISGRPICADDRCVECTVDDESSCGDNSCDPATGSCTATPRDSVGVCEPCRADSECQVGHLCMPMRFQETPREGGFCLPLEDDGCPQLYPIVTTVQTSLSGVLTTTCYLNEDLTTCEAVADYFKICTDADDCGVPGLDDGKCEPVDFDRAGCTYDCAANSECPFDSIGCAAGNLDEKWCGAY